MVGELASPEFRQQFLRSVYVSVHVLHFFVGFLKILGTGDEGVDGGERVLHLNHDDRGWGEDITWLYDHFCALS